MNKQLNSAIAYLEGKGFTFDKLSPGGIQPYVIHSENLEVDNNWNIHRSHFHFAISEENILALAKSAGWTGEEWEPKEGEYVWCAYLVPKAVTLERFYHVQNGFALRDSRIFPCTPAGLAQAKKKAGIEVEG